MPLDGGSVELCKSIARKQEQKVRLDYELVRIKECIAIYQKGFKIHPSSPFFPVCADVIPLTADVTKSEEQASLEVSQASSQ